jgi:hypothetical protein
VDHPSGFWANPDQKTPRGHSKSVPACGALCASMPGCRAFEVYDPGCRTEPIAQGGSACYTFSHGLGLPFHHDSRGLIRTCVRKESVREN